MDLRGRSLLTMTSLTAGEFTGLTSLAAQLRIKALMIATMGGLA